MSAELDESMQETHQALGSQGGFLEEETPFSRDPRDEQEFALEWERVYGVTQEKGNYSSTLVGV